MLTCPNEWKRRRPYELEIYLHNDKYLSSSTKRNSGDVDNSNHFWLHPEPKVPHSRHVPGYKMKLYFDNLPGHLLDYERNFLTFSQPQMTKKFPLLLFIDGYRFFQQFNFVFFPPPRCPKNKIRTRLRFRISSLNWPPTLIRIYSIKYTKDIFQFHFPVLSDPSPADVVVFHIFRYQWTPTQFSFAYEKVKMSQECCQALDYNSPRFSFTLFETFSSALRLPRMCPFRIL